jgi:hypothetical protein
MSVESTQFTYETHSVVSTRIPQQSTREQQTVVSKILHLKESYYETHTKNVFMKSEQKFDCARGICSQVGIVPLMDQTFWIVPNKNQVYFDYYMYKLYGNPDNFRLVIDNVLLMAKWCVQEYGSFEIHLNLASFTISAAERYKNMIQMFCDICRAQTECQYIKHLVRMHVYNLPTVVEHISKLLMPILPPEILPKMKLFHKVESLPYLNELYTESGKIYTA